MRYDDLNNKFEDLRVSNFNAAYSEVGVALLIKRVFANYLGVSDAFIADDSFIQPCVPYKDKTEIRGWSYVSLYACDNDKQLKLVLDFEKIKIPRELLNSAPEQIKGILPREVTNCNVQELSEVFDFINSKPEYSVFGNELREFVREYSLRQYNFDSVTDNGYFIFYLGVCFARSENGYSKNIRTIKLGITLYENNIVELAIFDTESEFEKTSLVIESKHIGLFNLALCNNDEERIKQYLVQLNNSREFIIHTHAKSIIDFVTSNDIYKKLYSTHYKEQTFYPYVAAGDYNTKENRIVEYIQFDVSNIKSWIELINTDDFQKAAHLIPDEVLERIFIRYKWFMEKNYNYYFKQINSNKNKDYNENGQITNINQPIFINGSNSQITNAPHSLNSNIVNKKTDLKLFWGKLILFGSAFGTGVAITISKLDVIIKYIRNFWHIHNN